MISSLDKLYDHIVLYFSDKQFSRFDLIDAFPDMREDNKITHALRSLERRKDIFRTGESNSNVRGARPTPMYKINFDRKVEHVSKSDMDMCCARLSAALDVMTRKRMC